MLPPSPILKIYLNINPPIYYLGLLSVLLPSGFPTKTLYAPLLSSSYLRLMLLLGFFSPSFMSKCLPAL